MCGSRFESKIYCASSEALDLAQPQPDLVGRSAVGVDVVIVVEVVDAGARVRGEVVGGRVVGLVQSASNLRHAHGRRILDHESAPLGRTVVGAAVLEAGAAHFLRLPRHALLDQLATLGLGLGARGVVAQAESVETRGIEREEDVAGLRAVDAVAVGAELFIRVGLGVALATEDPPLPRGYIHCVCSARDVGCVEFCADGGGERVHDGHGAGDDAFFG